MAKNTPIILYVGDIERASYAIPVCLLEFLEDIIPTGKLFTKDIVQNNLIISEEFLEELLKEVKDATK